MTDSNGTTVPEDQLISDVTSDESSLGTSPTESVSTVSTEPAHLTISTNDPATVITSTSSPDFPSSPFATTSITTDPDYATEAQTATESSETTYSTLPYTVYSTPLQSMYYPAN